MGAFGIKGMMKVKILTDFTERFEEGRRIRIDDKWHVIEVSQIHNNQLVLKLSDVVDRNEVESLYQKFIEAMEGERPPLEKDEFLTKDLIGMSVITKEGEVLGKVDQVMPMPAHDILVVGEVMIPMVKAFVKKVDISAKIILVQLIEGMRGEDTDTE